MKGRWVYWTKNSIPQIHVLDQKNNNIWYWY
jgi:hypothetical protein